MHLTWFSHIAVRYAAMMVAVTLLPLAIVLFAYDRYASNPLDTLSGSEAEQRLAVMQGRITSFLEARFAQLDTLANYPDLPLAFGRAAGTPPPSGLRAVLEYESDNPDLYGILIFDAQDAVIAAIPSQAAAGAPYWGGKWEGLSFTTASGEVNMKLGKGHQALQPVAYGTFKYDKESGKPQIVDVVTYAAECVNPPEGAKSVDWIKGGLKGAKCD